MSSYVKVQFCLNLKYIYYREKQHILTFAKLHSENNELFMLLLPPKYKLSCFTLLNLATSSVPTLSTLHH